MKLLYINDLRNLPNLGCRSTGAALAELLTRNHTLIRRDGLETVAWSGWDYYAPSPLRLGGLPFNKAYRHLWKHRFSLPRVFPKLKRLDATLGALHDFISSDPNESVSRFRLFTKKYKDLNELLLQLRAADAVVINGEGTLIFATPTQRDALYLLFIIALARSEKKPVYLLNAMITECPYTGADQQVLDHAAPLLAYCNIVACRDESSFSFVNSLIGSANLRLIPDALFTWEERFRSAVHAIKTEPGLCISFRSELDYSSLNFNAPYLCVSGSSSAWRLGKDVAQRFSNLITSLQSLGIKIYCIETCDGDFYLRDASKLTGTPLITKDTSVMAAAGILCGSLVYVTGRYHPAIMASANGVPCVFIASNSHKTRTVQELLGYDNPHEFSALDNDDIEAIVARVNTLINDGNELRSRIRWWVQHQASRAHEYETVIS